MSPKRATLPDQLVAIDLAVIATGVSHWTIRSWARRLRVASCCDVRTRQVRVSLRDTLNRAQPPDLLDIAS